MNEQAGMDIIIVNWNAGMLLNRCVRSILNSEQISLVKKIIIVDNASTDNSLNTIPAHDCIHFIKNQENIGFAAACNQGAMGGNSSYIVMLNPDVQLFENTLAASYAFMESNKNVDVMGCRQLDDDIKTLPSCARFPVPARFWNDALGLSKLFPKIFKPALLMTDWDHQSSGYVDQVIGSFMFIRSEVFHSIGKFDPRFFVYYEELDFSKRLAEKNGKSYYNAGISLIHSCNGTTEKVKAFRLYLNLTSRLLYCQKHFSRTGYWLSFLATMFVEPVTRTIYSAFRGGKEDVTNTIKGYRMIWKKWLKP